MRVLDLKCTKCGTAFTDCMVDRLAMLTPSPEALAAAPPCTEPGSNHGPFEQMLTAPAHGKHSSWEVRK